MHGKGILPGFAIALLAMELFRGFFFGPIPVQAATSSVELIVALAECADGTDNDGDTLIDFPADPDCASTVDDDESTPPAPPSSGASVVVGGGGGGGVGAFPVSSSSRSLPPSSQLEQTARAVLERIDFDDDGEIGVPDLSILLYFYGQPIATAGHYDLNGDRQVDILDISIFFYYWP